MKMVPVVVTKKVARSVLAFKKASPNLMFAGGVAGMVASTILACKATLKLSEELPEMKNELDRIKEEVKDEGEQRTLITQTQVINVGRVVRLYGPSVVVGGLAIGALTGSHVSLTRRNAGLTAAYAAVSKAYDDYRERVRGDIGADKELELYRASSSMAVQVDDDKPQEIMVVDPNTRSPYSRIFDETSPYWQKNAEMNRLFVQTQQTYANERLRANGHVFLNEVYDLLGFERTKAGAVVGWVLNNDGDNYVDFGLFEASSAPFINGYERSCILDFNVDGVIYDKI